MWRKTYFLWKFEPAMIRRTLQCTQVVKWRHDAKLKIIRSHGPSSRLHFWRKSPIDTYLSGRGRMDGWSREIPNTHIFIHTSAMFCGQMDGQTKMWSNRVASYMIYGRGLFSRRVSVRYCSLTDARSRRRRNSRVYLIVDRMGTRGRRRRLRSPALCAKQWRSRRAHEIKID